MNRIKLTQEQKQQILYLYKSISNKELAARFNITETSLCRIARKAGMTKRSTLLSQEQKNTVCELYVQGDSTKYLANKFGVSKSTILETLKINNINPKIGNPRGGYLNIGSKFGKLVITKLDHESENPHKVYWDCKCDCGTTVAVRQDVLKGGLVRSCGCLLKESIRKSTNKKNHERVNKLIGKEFGWLTIKDYKGTKSGNVIVTCLCRCGRLKDIKLSSITNMYKPTNSCGCYHKFSVSAKWSLPSGEAGFRSVYRRYQQQAQIRDLQFSLTEEEARDLFQQNCYYCGTKPSQIEKTHKSEFIYNGIDRVDNLEGYLKTNCVSCCGLCNWMKKDLNIADFKWHIEKIYNTYYNYVKKVA